MDVERFESDLGEVAITESHIERERENSDEWDRIEENFSEKRLVDRIHFRDIEEIEHVHGSVYPNILFKTEEGRKRMFFHIGDPVEECFEELEYRLKVYREIY